MRTIDTVLFDLDDTLHDDTAAYQTAVRRVAADLARSHGIDAAVVFDANAPLSTPTWTNTIDNTSNAQTWTWNSLTTQTAFTLSSSSLTNGSILSLQNTAVAVPSTGEERLRSMLTGMGFRPAEAERAVTALGPRAASEPIEGLLREALALLAK